MYTERQKKGLLVIFIGLIISLFVPLGYIVPMAGSIISSGINEDFKKNKKRSIFFLVAYSIAIVSGILLVISVFKLNFDPVTKEAISVRNGDMGIYGESDIPDYEAIYGPIIAVSSIVFCASVIPVLVSGHKYETTLVRGCSKIFEAAKKENDYIKSKNLEGKHSKISLIFTIAAPIILVIKLSFMNGGIFLPFTDIPFLLPVASHVASYIQSIYSLTISTYSFGNGTLALLAMQILIFALLILFVFIKIKVIINLFHAYKAVEKVNAV